MSDQTDTKKHGTRRQDEIRTHVRNHIKSTNQAHFPNCKWPKAVSRQKGPRLTGRLSGWMLSKGFHVTPCIHMYSPHIAEQQAYAVIVHTGSYKSICLYYRSQNSLQVKARMFKRGWTYICSWARQRNHKRYIANIVVNLKLVSDQMSITGPHPGGHFFCIPWSPSDRMLPGAVAILQGVKSPGGCRAQGLENSSFWRANAASNDSKIQSHRISKFLSGHDGGPRSQCF